MLYEILKTSKLGASFAPDMYTALWAQKLARDGEVKTLSGAPPLSFQANGTPLLDYLISGNTVQSGTPTSDNQIMPQGTGERTGNLAKYWKPAYVTAAGSVNTNRVNGTSFPVKLEAGQTVSFTNQKAIFGRGIAIFSDFDGETLTNMLYRSTNNTVIYTADSACYVIIWGNYDNTTSMDETVFNLCGQMLNLGSTPLPYEPYGYKIPISSANTTTPVYLGEVETTRKIKKYEFTGQESWSEYSSSASGIGASLLLTDILSNSRDNGFCTHFSPQYSPSQSAIDGITFGAGNKAVYITFSTATATALNLTDTTSIKTWIATQYAAGTPVTVWYVLANEETGIVNEPIRKIGDYADTVSYEQAGVEIPTARGTNTIDVLTDVKPSEIYIKYKRRNNNE